MSDSTRANQEAADTLGESNSGERKFTDQGEAGRAPILVGESPSDMTEP